MNDKYELVKDQTIIVERKTLYRIRALRDISPYIKKGMIGGYIQSESNLSERDRCWIWDDAKVYGNARVINNAQIFGSAKVYDNACVRDESKVYGHAQIYGNSYIKNNASISDLVIVKDFVCIYGNAQVIGCCTINDRVIIGDNALIRGDVKIYNDVIISGSARIRDFVSIFDRVRISDSANISGNAKLSGSVIVKDEASIGDYAIVTSYARILGNCFIFGNAKISQNMYLRYSKCSTDLSLKENIADNIRCQTNLPVLSDKKGDYVLGFKHVNKTFSIDGTLDEGVFMSGYDPNFKYYLGLWKEVKDPHMSNKSCASGLHFSNLSYWENRGCDTVIQVKCYLDDIITIQEGKIRCKKLLPLAVVKNGQI